MSTFGKVLLTIAIILVLGVIIYFVFFDQPQSSTNGTTQVTASPTAVLTTPAQTTPDSKPTFETGQYTEIDVEQAYDLIQSDSLIVVLDVSSAYEKGHLPGAINYYVGDGSLDDAIPTLDKSKTYLVYCHVPAAAQEGAQKLIDAGFEKVYLMVGEYSGWVEAGYPTEK